jgi:hypothetical protein
MNMEKLFEFSDLEVWVDGDRYFAIYDAGAHQVVWRRDEINKHDAALARTGPEGAGRMLLALQKRLSDAGVDPYVANFDRG